MIGIPGVLSGRHQWPLPTHETVRGAWEPVESTPPQERPHDRAGAAPSLDSSQLDAKLASALRLGVLELDSDHQHMVAHYQALTRALDADQYTEAFAVAFQGLLCTTNQHFLREEKMMKDAGFPGYDLHRAAHNKLLRDGHDFLANILHVFGQDECRAVAKFFKYWVIGHIETHDKVFAKFLQKADRI